MIKSIKINLDVFESMLYYWNAVVDKEKVSESFFVDIANMESMKLIQREDFSAESVRKVLSSIQNRELLSSATKAEKRFWSKNMWIAEDVSLASKMAQPIKTLNIDDLVDMINDKYDDIDTEDITIHIVPLHLDTYYINKNNLIINFFNIYFSGENEAIIDDKPLKTYILEKLCELIEIN